MKQNNSEISTKLIAPDAAKKEYLPPIIEVIIVEMEQGIAAQSATLNPGTSTDPYIPQTEDWIIEPSLGEGKYDL